MAGIGPLGSQSTGAALDNQAEVYKGADFVRDYQWLIDGVPVDITGATGASEMRQSDGTVLFEPTFAIIDAEEGRLQVTIAAVDTAAETPDIPASVVTVSSPMDFEFQDKYESLSYFINITISGYTYQLVRGFAKFYA